MTPLIMSMAMAGLVSASNGAPATSANAGASTRLVQPNDLVYKGAFRLPDGPDEIAWGWSGQAMTYYPDGDTKGPVDGHPGSLFGVGHDWKQFVSEVSIPKPVISTTRNLNELNTATTLQGFQDIRGTLFGPLEQARAGLAYLPKQGKQTTGKLYFCWGPHMHDGHADPSHGWCELDLSNPRPAGPWRVGNRINYVTTDYIFQIPKAWADAHTPGQYLATGRFRDGGQGGQGPSLLAFGPWNDGNPPRAGARLKCKPLLLYSDVTAPTQHKLIGYHHSDEWSGGAWLTAGRKSAVVFVGTKGQGKCWYGFANGVVWPEEPPYPPVPDSPNDDRGWWSTGFVGQMLFFDPDDLAAVAAGKKKPHEPQPYATLAIDKVLFGIRSTQQQRHVGAACFDRTRGFLYVFEFRGDGDKSLVHVWRLTP